MTDKLQEAVTAKAGPVTVKMSKLVDARQMLQFLSNTPLPASISLRLSRLSRAANAELEEYDKQRARLLKENAVTKDGQHFDFPNAARRELFERQIEALGEEDVELPAVTLTLRDLGSLDVPPALFEHLNWVFPETADEEAAEAKEGGAGGQPPPQGG